ncbi:MAG: PIG-L family deacetylase, partial [Bacteroidota bacterium]
MKVDILAIAAHPDDIELACSGTLLGQIARGNTVGLLDLTQGELGTRGSAPLRLQEAEAARALMGAKFRINLGLKDGFFRNTEENLKKVIRVIRMAQPDIVLANSLEDRHIDHSRGAKLAADACFLSGLVKVETFDEEGKQQERWRP